MKRACSVLAYGDQVGQTPSEGRVLAEAVRVAVPIQDEDGQGDEGG